MTSPRAGIRAVLLGLAVFVAAGRASTVYFNGGFQTGGLTGWTPFTTGNGTLGVTFPTVVPFNTAGTGPVSSAQFQVGQTAFNPGDWEGGGMYQNILLPAGQLTLSVDIAAMNPGSFTNGYAGRFNILIDMKPVAGYDLGALAAGQVVRSTVDYSFLGDGKQHTIGFEFLRPAVASSSTPYEYLDGLMMYYGNDGASAPEPATFALLGFGLVAVVFYRRKNPPAIPS